MKCLKLKTQTSHHHKNKNFFVLLVMSQTLIPFAFSLPFNPSQKELIRQEKDKTLRTKLRVSKDYVKSEIKNADIIHSFIGSGW
ncbi:hypothetical protein [Helicobacter cetorum]|uniref:Uncharacterized protein n=1 Tax=Helicobacter cetorum (strain ATCC BAA-540 / CCUG 52418 / MIT 99-5656) TaxID=1163745 RepID=I0ERE3_HELCM|nr:hypothetical protein [Helicobacter cetorum]AFI05512.1 hypothetical protein HCD_02460 [Helicobacter cetorum MIT 99-5656]